MLKDNLQHNEGQLDALKLYRRYKHEQNHAAERARVPEPWKIRHVEGGLNAELKLHHDIVESYEHHRLAAALEQYSMWESIEEFWTGTRTPMLIDGEFANSHGPRRDLGYVSAKGLFVLGVFLRQYENSQNNNRGLRCWMLLVFWKSLPFLHPF